MQNILFPKSVAVIGVSHQPDKIGYIVFDNLVSGFSGKVYGVNPNKEPVMGEKLYGTVLEIPDKIDLAVITVPAKIVPQVLESCGKKRIPNVIIISAGFSEIGKAGILLEQEATLAAKKFGIRVLGPNCLGVINNMTGLNASFAGSKMPPKYRVGIFSQSGAMGAAILDFANGGGFGFSYFVSLGNKNDISETDLISSWEDDENVDVAIGYIEDIKKGKEFLEVVKKFTAKKPLIILKGGTTDEGSNAARLHTAALTSDYIVFKASMEEAGVILANDLADLFEFSVAFAENKLPKGKRLAIISNAGGPAVLAADACSRENIELANPSHQTVSRLSERTRAASMNNPFDLRGDATSKEFFESLKIIEADPNFDAILTIITPQAMTELEDIAWEAVMIKKISSKPIFMNFIGGELVEKAINICRENGVTVFSYPERAVRAFRYQAEFHNRRKIHQQKQKKHPKYNAAKSIISYSPKGMNPERLSALLSLYGIPMAKTLLVRTEKQAIQALNQITPPVVMKISSPDILHKTEVGGVMLGINSEVEAKNAYNRILRNVGKKMPEAEITGITVMQTAKEGLELLVGAKKDPIFGPVVIFGFGGIFVELVSDFSVAVGPFSEEKIKRLISQTKVSKIINGYRRESVYSEKSLIKAVLGLASIISEHPEILQIEVNPLILEENGGLLGLDAKIQLDVSVIK